MVGDGLPGGGSIWTPPPQPIGGGGIPCLFGCDQSGQTLLTLWWSTIRTLPGSRPAPAWQRRQARPRRSRGRWPNRVSRTRHRTTDLRLYVYLYIFFLDFLWWIYVFFTNINCVACCFIVEAADRTARRFAQIPRNVVEKNHRNFYKFAVVPSHK